MLVATRKDEEVERFPIAEGFIAVLDDRVHGGRDSNDDENRKAAEREGDHAGF